MDEDEPISNDSGLLEILKSYAEAIREHLEELYNFDFLWEARTLQEN